MILYFVITILVEGFSLRRWLKRNNLTQSSGSFWLGILLANTATYLVLAPIHYLATKPIDDVKEFTAKTGWANQPPTRIVCIDPKTHYLKYVYSDGTRTTNLVP